MVSAHPDLMICAQVSTLKTSLDSFSLAPALQSQTWEQATLTHQEI